VGARRGGQDLSRHPARHRRREADHADPPAYDSTGSTRYVDFTTTKSVYETLKSQLNCVVMDSRWEAKLAAVLDEMPRFAPT